MPLIDHFGVIAPYYDRLIQLREPDRLIIRADLPVNGMLLDAGGGTGRVAQKLLGLASQVVVADLSMGMLRQASIKPGLLKACLHTESMPFSDGSFERIIMVDALHHVIDQQATIAEMWRLLKPGGKIVIEEPDVRVFAVKLVALGEKMALMRSHFLSPPRIQRLFNFPGAQSKIEVDGFNAWIIVDRVNKS
jgi:ubiquinone/menaquinone biosynthesis C-methylase UbiE